MIHHLKTLIGEERKIKNTRFNIFGEPAGHDPEARGSDRDGDLWDEPDGGDVNHLLLEGDEGEGQEEEPQLENLTETAYTTLAENPRKMSSQRTRWK